MQRKAFSRVGVNVWNELPNESKKFVKEILQKRKKKSSSQYFIETEDSYIEPDEIVVKFKHSKIESN